MPRVGFEPNKIPASEQERTVHALDRSTTLIGYVYQQHVENKIISNFLMIK
jgi:hypothetical protein